MHIYALPITGHLKDQSTNWIVLLKLLQCQKLVNEYAPEIIELLLQELQPDEICTELGLCSSEKKLLRGEKKKHMHDGNTVGKHLRMREFDLDGISYRNCVKEARSSLQLCARDHVFIGQVKLLL